jgi:CRISPR/Cas system-associated exonuclease Cas4 (RecB family)
MTVQREDLSQRTTLSKSALNTFDMCGQKAWFEIHHRAPFIGNPDVTFGSCVDAGTELAIRYARAGQPPELERMTEAAREVTERDQIEVRPEEVELALSRFNSDVLPAWDWSLAKTQEHLHVPLFDWGEVDGHPDILLPDTVLDVKTSKRSKDTARTVELGLYALMAKEATGKDITRVGYITWVRRAKPAWETLLTEVTPDFLEWTCERVSAYVRAKNADELLNRRASSPVNWTFPSGPKNAGLCRTCQYNPSFEPPVPCRMAPCEEITDVA